MPRRKKPPGLEKWTWEEINAGRKMSKTEKRYRNMFVAFGATKAPNGGIQPPKAQENPLYYAVVIGLLVLGFVVLVLSVKK